MYAMSKVNDRTYRYSNIFAVWYFRYRYVAIHFDCSSWIQVLCVNVFAIYIHHQPILEDSNINFVPIFVEDLFQSNALLKFFARQILNL